MIIEDNLGHIFSPTLCVTHRCNLNCVYCYQKNKEFNTMDFSTGTHCIDDIFSMIPQDVKMIEISFIGGEPLLEFELIKKLYEYTFNKYKDDRVHFFATTNGTVLNEESKRWLTEHRNRFVLGLSLDGQKETHDRNRSNSFDDIDIPFFLENWPKQGVKMTLSEKSLDTLAQDIMFIHSLGFKSINGVNFAEGDFDWDNKLTLKKISVQLNELLNYYSNNYDLVLDQMFGKHIEYCSASNKRKYRSCGIGTKTILYDTDGTKYPCSFVTPLTFSPKELKEILLTNFNDENTFVDRSCEKCYILPVCGTCSGANYLLNGTFSKRNKTRCNLNKIIVLYIAEYHARKILLNRDYYKDSNQLFYLIEAIKSIRNEYLPIFRDILVI